MHLTLAPHVGEIAALGTALLHTFSTLAMTSAGKRVGVLAVNFIGLLLGCGLMMVYGHTLWGRWLPSDAPLRAWLLLGASGVFGFLLCLLR